MYRFVSGQRYGELLKKFLRDNYGITFLDFIRIVGISISWIPNNSLGYCSCKKNSNAVTIGWGGMGGSAQFDAPSSLLAMCAVHNGLAEASSEFAAYCQRNGLSITRRVAAMFPISRIPARYADGWYLLDGLNRHAIPDDVAVDLMAEIYGEDEDQ